MNEHQAINPEAQEFVFPLYGEKDSQLNFYIAFPIGDFGDESVFMALFYGQWGMPDSVIITELKTAELNRSDMAYFFCELKEKCDSVIADNELTTDQVSKGSPSVGLILSGDSAINVVLLLEPSGIIFQWESQGGGTDAEGRICLPGGDYHLLSHISSVLEE